jgi:hypothetical protein
VNHERDDPDAGGPAARRRQFEQERGWAGRDELSVEESARQPEPEPTDDAPTEGQP